MVLQTCMHFLKDVRGSHSEMCLASQNGNQINIKVEDVTDIQEEEDPVPTTFPVIKAEEQISCMCVNC
jgi:hypothetical protein